MKAGFIRVEICFAAQIDRRHGEPAAAGKNRRGAALAFLRRFPAVRISGGHKSGHVQRLFDMQRARFSVRAEPAVIGNAVGAVAVLLDFGNQDAAADRVQRSGFDEEYIALVGWDGIDHLGEGVVLDPAAEFFLCDLMMKSR